MTRRRLAAGLEEAPHEGDSHRRVRRPRGAAPRGRARADARATGEIVVRCEAAGVNYLDTYHRTGLYPNPLPLVPGMEGAGVVTAVGPDVTLFRHRRPRRVDERDRLLRREREDARRQGGGGAGRDRAAHGRRGDAPGHDRAVPDASTFPLGKGHTCLVHAAAGGVGLLLVQMAKRRGARVIGTVGSEAKAALARAAGADEVILYSAGGLRGRRQAARRTGAASTWCTTASARRPRSRASTAWRCAG